MPDQRWDRSIVEEPKGAELAGALLRHFDASRRALPWRGTSDPYAIWVSEVMLQQTRVDTVRPYYERWLARFPTIEALADAGLDDVLRAWQGLGYYSRARHLHAAARLVRERHGGAVPADPAALRALPGVGEYTAGAVASIAYGVPAPAVDGNARRVLARVYDLQDPTSSRLRGLAANLVPSDRPGDFNQALMELGATVCTPRTPDCGACPIARWCRARELGVQASRPRRRSSGPLPEETVETAVVARRGDGALLLVRRPDRGLLAGMWEFPGDDRPGWVARLVDAAEPVGVLEPVPHVFSHKKVTYLPTLYRAARTSGGVEPPGAWVRPAELAAYALPAAQRRVAALATSELSARRPAR